MAIMNNALPLLWVVVSPFSMPKPPNNPPTLMQHGLFSSIIPIKFQKQEEVDQRRKD